MKLTALIAATLTLFTSSSLVSASPVDSDIFPEDAVLAHTFDKRALTYKQITLRHHNTHRRNHSATAMTWGPALRTSALTLAKRCVFAHNTTIGPAANYGQNLAAGYPASAIGPTITDLWYSEAPNFAGSYGQATPSNFDSKFGTYGHFTQLVWVGSKRVGCATFDCGPSGGLKDGNGNRLQGLDNFTVCNYGPAGNYLGEFDKNVLKPIGLPTYSGQ